MAKHKQQPQEAELRQEADDAERVFVTFTDDFVVSDGEKELVITINVEFAFDVPLDGKFNDDNIVLMNNNYSREYLE